MPSFWENLLTPNAALIQAKLEAIDAARKEYDLAVSRLAQYYEQLGQSETERAAETLARYGALTSTTLAKAAGRIRAEKMTRLSDVYGRAEMDRAAARAEKEELRRLKDIVKTQELLGLGKQVLGTAASIAGLGTGGIGGTILSGVGSALTGTDYMTPRLQSQLSQNQAYWGQLYQPYQTSLQGLDRSWSPIGGTDFSPAMDRRNFSDWWS